MFAVRSYVVAAVLVAALFLAVARPSSGAGPEERYAVRAGDTLWALAERHYGGDPREGVWRISERNGLGGSLLHPGMVLYLPAPGGDA
jgi:nucleoid-associated protein YgaU